MSKSPLAISNLFSEGYSSECQMLVFVRKRIYRYVDEQNWQLMPLEWAEAGEETGNGL